MSFLPVLFSYRRHAKEEDCILHPSVLLHRELLGAELLFLLCHSDIPGSTWRRKSPLTCCFPLGACLPWWMGFKRKKCGEGGSDGPCCFPPLEECGRAHQSAPHHVVSSWSPRRKKHGKGEWEVLPQTEEGSSTSQQPPLLVGQHGNKALFFSLVAPPHADTFKQGAPSSAAGNPHNPPRSLGCYRNLMPRVP